MFDCYIRLLRVLEHSGTTVQAFTAKIMSTVKSLAIIATVIKLFILVMVLPHCTKIKKILLISVIIQLIL